jgi:class 3 adenylate cyclase
MQRRAEVVEMVSKYYELQTSQKLPVRFAEDRELKQHVTTKEAMKAAAAAAAALSSATPADHDGNTEQTESRVNASPSLRAANDPSGPGHSRFRSNIGFSLFKANVLKGWRKPNVRLEGWLTKQKGNKDRWDRKYFILTDRTFMYYSPRIKGNIGIVGCEVAELEIKSAHQTVSLAVGRAAPDDQASSPVVTDPLKCAFAVRSKSKTLYLAAESEHDRKRWLQAFLAFADESDVNKAEDDDDVEETNHLEGWLLKKDPTSKAWRKRYFVIYQHRCWYFEMARKGAVDVANGLGGHDAKEIEPTERSHANFAGLTSASRFAYRFTVSDGDRLYKLGADSKDDMDAWLTEIDSAGKSDPSMTNSGSRKLKAVIPDEIADSIAQPAPQGSVTFVFTDVQSSTSLWENAPDDMDLSLTQHDNILRRLLKKFRGYEVKTEGDAFMVTFFSPLDAILWCLAVQKALFEAQWTDGISAMKGALRESTPDGKPVFNGIRIRMGIHTGETECKRNPTTRRMDYYGPVVNRSARVSDAGHGGQIVMTQEVYDILQSDEGKNHQELQSMHPVVTDIGAHVLKGIKEPVQIYEVLPAELAERSSMFPPLRAPKFEPTTNANATTADEKHVADEKADSLPVDEDDSSDDEDFLLADEDNNDIEVEMDEAEVENIKAVSKSSIFVRLPSHLPPPPPGSRSQSVIVTSRSTLSSASVPQTAHDV